MSVNKPKGSKKLPSIPSITGLDLFDEDQFKTMGDKARETFLNFNRTNSFMSQGSSSSREEDIDEIKLQASPSKNMINYEINAALETTFKESKPRSPPGKHNRGLLGVTILEHKGNDVKPLNVSHFSLPGIVKDEEDEADVFRKEVVEKMQENMHKYGITKEAFASGHMFTATKTAIDATQQIVSQEEYEEQKKIDYRPLLAKTNTSIRKNVTRLKKYLNSPDLYGKITDNENCSVDLSAGEVVYFMIEAGKKKSPWLLLVNYQ